MIDNVLSDGSDANQKGVSLRREGRRQSLRTNAGFYAAKQEEAPVLGGMEIFGVGEIQQGMTVLDSYPDLELPLSQRGTAYAGRI